MTVGDGSNTMTEDLGSRQNNIAELSIAPNEDKLIKDTMTSSATAATTTETITTETTTAETTSNNKIIVDGLRENTNGEIATIGGYEVISNTSERPENNAMKVFVLCVKL
jgi:hypothetical protein